MTTNYSYYFLLVIWKYVSNTCIPISLCRLFQLWILLLFIMWTNPWWKFDTTRPLLLSSVKNRLETNTILQVFNTCGHWVIYLEISFNSLSSYKKTSHCPLSQKRAEKSVVINYILFLIHIIYVNLRGVFTH